MRHQRFIDTQTTPIIVDEDIGIPTSLIEEYRKCEPSGSADPRSLLLSMSEYDKPLNYDVYDYQPTTRPEQAQHYASFAAAHHQPYTHEYVSTQAQATSGLSQVSELPFLPPTQAIPAAHDQLTFYPDQATQYPSYADSGVRHLPEILSFAPSAGTEGTKVSVYFQSSLDLQSLPQTSVVIMFGHKRCDSVLERTSASNSPHQFVVSATAPSWSITGTSADMISVPLNLALDGPPRTWQSPQAAVGSFTYINDLSLQTPSASSRKRKLSIDTDDRQSPAKKQSYQQLPKNPLPAQARRFSQPEYQYAQNLPRVQTQQYYQPASAAARLQTEQSPLSYGYYSSVSSATRSPSTTVIPATRSAQILPSPSGNPPLIRTSTIQQSPSTSGLSSALTQSFNPYAMYPANTKAQLKIDGDLNSMVENWSEAEWETKRRLVQFQRSQSGSLINTTFEPVSPEERLPNSICVSCIWWEEKQECYVTSVDTIQLLESLVAVRFTVEEKNRIRRNLEGFRPATVSKQKSDSEDFFKLIMGFPNPKPRNIEKDVKVFPWRILSTALKKIIGKYSASYSSTAGALHSPAGSSYAAGMDRAAASPHSTSSSVTSHGQAYATSMTNQSYVPHQRSSTTNVRGMLSAGPPDLRLAVPSIGPAAIGWHPSPVHYAAGVPTDLSATATTGRTPSSWDYNTNLTAYSMTPAAPSASSQYHFGATRMPQSIQSQSAGLADSHFIPLHEYEQSSQPTTTNAQ